MTYLKHYLAKCPKEKQSSAAISFLAGLDYLKEVSPEVEKAISGELESQRSHLKMIASENFSSLAVQIAMGNLLTDKYSEGFVKHRFYAGCENVDIVEELANEELKKIFECDHAYVQPHSGADANLIAYWAILVERVQSKEIEALGKMNLEELSDSDYEKVRRVLLNQKMMGMSLNSGGHLTHGYRHNISSKMMHAIPYDVDPKTELLDYKAIAELAKREKPLILVAGYSAYPRLIDFSIMKEIADSVGAALLVDMAHFAGLVAGKVLTGVNNPIPYADIVTSTTHKTMRGPRGGMILCKEEFKDIVNKGCPLVMGGPLPHVMAAKAIAFKEANTKTFQDYAHQIVKNAQVLGEHLASKGVKLFTGGTDNHLLVVNVAESFGLTGRQAELLLRRARITVNRNAIPFDVNGPWYGSGIRIGTPALTTLGMKEKEMKSIGDLIISLLKNAKPALVEKTGKVSRAKANIDEAVLKKIQDEVAELLSDFPLYPEIKTSEYACV